MPQRIYEANLQVLPALQQKLTLKGYSPATIRTYCNEVAQFLYVLKSVPAESMTPERIRSYMQYCHEKLKLREATLHSRINALKFYYEQVLGRDKFFWDIPRPKKHFQLPKVLSERELTRLFRSPKNLKHKAILFTAYSAGLRVSEVVNLKLKDIDSDRMQILIEKAKGKKDRYVSLSILLLDILRGYLRQCQPMPSVYLFENPMNPGQPYSIRSVQKIFNVACRMAGIQKHVGIHSLRHSFATHILEKGVDIKYIQELLGHYNIKTTERYLHVKRDQLIVLPNPLDELYKNKRLDY
jgi:integrase/recombinase XerD